MTQIQIVPTDPMVANYPNADGKMFSFGETVFNSWLFHIDEDGNHSASVTAQTSGGITVPVTHDGETVLPNNSISDRLNGAASYLQDAESDLMDEADAVLIADYFDGSGLGLAQDIGTAGNSTNFTGIVNTRPEDAGELPPEASTFGSEGIGFHEVLHLYDGIHSEAATQHDDQTNWFTAIWSPASDNPGCSNPVIGQYQDTRTSFCTTDTVQDYLDSNNLV